MKIKNWKRQKTRFGIKWINKVTKQEIKVGIDVKRECWVLVYPYYPHERAKQNYLTKEHAMKHAYLYMKTHTTNRLGDCYNKKEKK